MKGTMALARASAPPESWMDAVARRVVQRSLRGLSHGKLTLIDDGVRTVYGDESSALAAKVRVERPDAYRRVLFGGTIGAGTAYMDGAWTTHDLPALMRIFALNEHTQLGLEGGVARLGQVFARAFHAFRRNTKRGSLRNIAEHYDLGNDFYRLFLDETMAYSCGIFESDDATMAEASVAKFDRLCRNLRLSSNDHLLEIGTGWGGFAVHAARRYRCRVTTTTISDRQYEGARRRVEESGVADRVEVLRKDYRDLDGTYDKVVSIEMIEAVGDQYYDRFFAQCARLLAPDGLMALQAITIADQAFERHRREVDFIKRYIFPGSCIPSVTALLGSITRACDLRLVGLDDIGRHYVTTLRHWREAFWSRIDAVRAQGFSERFIRMWDFYLAYCEGGFAERYLGNVHMLLAKPGWRD